MIETDYITRQNYAFSQRTPSKPFLNADLFPRFVPLKDL